MENIYHSIKQSKILKTYLLLYKKINKNDNINLLLQNIYTLVIDILINSEDQKKIEKSYYKIQNYIVSLFPFLNSKKDIELLNNFIIDLKNFVYKRKKIFLLMTLSGNGHKKAAQGITEAIEYLYGKDYSIKIIDMFGYINMKQAFESGYEKIVQYIPYLYKTSFEMTDGKFQAKLLDLFTSDYIIDKIYDLYKIEQPDIIVSVYPYFVSAFKKIFKREKEDKKVITVVTDFLNIHITWIGMTKGDVDYLITPHTDTTEYVYKKHNFDIDKIKDFGFPLEIKFYDKLDKSLLKKQYNISKNNSVYTFMFCTGASTKDLNVLKKLDKVVKDKTFLILYGKNKFILEELQDYNFNNECKIIGWTDKVDEILEVSDLIITKAGGAIVAECIEKCVPMFINKVIPGQEEGNKDFILKNNLGYYEKDYKKMVDIIKSITKSDLNKIKSNIKKVQKNKASFDIAKFIINQI